MNINNALIKYCSLFTEWDASEIQQWKEIYVQGRNRFILQRGILIYGAILFFGLTVSAYYLEKPQTSEEILKLIYIRFSLCLLAGLAFGYGCWEGTCRAYNNMIEKRKNTQITESSSD